MAFSLVALALVLIRPAIAARSGAQGLQSPTTIEFDHDGQGVKGFVLYATRKEDGVEQRIDLGMPTRGKSGRMQIAPPPLPSGIWRLELAAYNSAGESPRAKAEPFEVRLDDSSRKPPPSAKASSPAKAEPKSPPTAQPQSPQQQKPPPPSKKKKGGLGKLWRVIIGEDSP